MNEINITEVSTDTLLTEVFSRFEFILVSLCSRDEDGNLQAIHHYRGPLHPLIAEIELLKDEILEGHRENIKEKRRDIHHPGEPWS